MADREGNLCASAQTSMLRGSTLLMLLALAATVTLVEVRASVPWWIAVGGLSFAAFLELYQSFSGICVVRAVLGVRRTEQGNEPIANPAELARVRRRARGVLALAVVSAIGATALLLALA